MVPLTPALTLTSSPSPNPNPNSNPNPNPDPNPNQVPLLEVYATAPAAAYVQALCPASTATRPHLLVTLEVFLAL